MLLRCNEGISPKFFYSQDDGLFQIGRKGAPMNAYLLISIIPNMLLVIVKASLLSVLTVRMIVYFGMRGKVLQLVAINKKAGHLRQPRV